MKSGRIGRKASLSGIVVATFMIVAGCSHEVQSPQPVGHGLEPDVVCNATPTDRPDSLIKIHGDHFTPMPTKLMQGGNATRLILPKVDLLAAGALASGRPAPSATVHYSGTPGGTNDKLLTWTSSKLMSFDVTPALGVAEGVYSVVVTNPDDKSAAKFDQALTVVPPPAISKVSPSLTCNAQGDRTLHIDGANFLVLDNNLPSVKIGDKTYTPTMNATSCVAVAGKHARESVVKLCSSMNVKLPKGDLDPTPDAIKVVDVVVTNPQPANCDSSSATFKLTLFPPPIISSVKPPSICEDQQNQTMTVSGKYFLELTGSQGSEVPTVTVGPASNQKTYTPTLSNCTQVPPNGTFNDEAGKKITAAQSCQTLTFVIKKGDFPVTNPTTLPIKITNPAPADCESADSTTAQVRVEPPPHVDTVAPSKVCTGGGQLTIDGSGFVCTDKNGNVPESNGQIDMSQCVNFPTVSLDCGSGTTPVQAGGVQMTPDGKTLTATFGAGTAANLTCNVIVTNPDGCEDRPLPHQTVTTTQGPILFLVDPGVVYNGLTTVITLYSTGVTPPLPSDAVSISKSGSQPITLKLVGNGIDPNHPNRVQAVVPKGTAAGTYNVTLTDAANCPQTLVGGLVITGQTSVTLSRVVPPFGWTNQDTAITIYRDTTAAAPNNKPFVDTPTIYLNPSTPGTNAVRVQNVSFVDSDTVTGVVPKGTAVDNYDVILVNPDGTVGVLKYDASTNPPKGYSELKNPPPDVTSVTPSSIIDQAGQTVAVSGDNLASGDTVTLTCVDPTGNSSTLTATWTCSSATSCSATVDGSSLAVGTVCVMRVTDPGGSSYGEYSAIGVTNSSLNLTTPQTGTDMVVGRRALSSAAGNATSAARFVYAIGGDDGAVSGALSSTEFAPVDPFGKMGTWQLSRYSLGGPRTLAGAATIGRYTYLVGGDAGSGPVKTVERAMILSPRETPVIKDLDLTLDNAGLGPGYWHYKVSAVFSSADLDNPGGESLPSDPITLKLPDESSLGKKILVKVIWSAPVDSQGVALPNVTGYRIYRTAKAGDPVSSVSLLAQVSGASTLSFTDDGSKSVDTTKTPLPLGSMGKWAKLADLQTARSGPGVAAAPDPTDATTWYVYALLGKNTNTSATNTYEYLPISIASNGHQTAAGSWTKGGSTSAQARWQLGAFVVNKNVFTGAGSDSWVFLGGGLTAANGNANNVEAGRVAHGGDFQSFGPAPKPTAGNANFTTEQAGYGYCAANDQLFTFGGIGATPSTGAKSATLVTPLPTLGNGAWNNEGLTMTEGRYLLGSSVQSAFIFLVGGQTPTATASKTTELVVW